MRESAEDLFPADPVLGEVDRFGWTGAGLDRGELAATGASTGSVMRFGVSTVRPSEDAAAVAHRMGTEVNDQ